MYEKNKIQQWTFELASAFVNYFVKSERIVLPSSLSFSQKSSSIESLTKSNIRREFSLKDPTYSLNINIPEPQSSIPSARHASTRFMFDSAQFMTGSQEPLILKPKPNFPLPSPKSVVGQSFSGITGLDFKQSTIKNRRQKDQSIAKSTCSKKRNSEIFGFDFTQRKNRLEDHMINVKVEREKEASEKEFNLDNKSKGKPFNPKEENSSRAS